MSSISDRLLSALGGSYTIERELTGGGMALVFVGEDHDLERKVVIKILPPELAASVSAERFRREILTVARLQHPHIVPILKAGEVDGLPYFVMPYVDGESIDIRLRRTPTFTVRETLGIMKDVARALAFAHAQGVVHRDIKPGNVLLAAGSATVTDFGVAKALSSARRSGGKGAGLTNTGMSLGTILYMAPEQAAGDPDIDGRADIYSLGITAYEMLAGTAPFAALGPRAMAGWPRAFDRALSSDRSGRSPADGGRAGRGAGRSADSKRILCVECDENCASRKSRNARGRRRVGACRRDCRQRGNL